MNPSTVGVAEELAIPAHTAMPPQPAIGVSDAETPLEHDPFPALDLPLPPPVAHSLSDDARLAESLASADDAFGKRDRDRLAAEDAAFARAIAAQEEAEDALAARTVAHTDAAFARQLAAEEAAAEAAANAAATLLSSEDLRLAEQLHEEEEAAVEADSLTAEALRGAGPFACMICMEESVPEHAGHTFAGCGHRFCTLCAAEHVRVRVGERVVSGEALTCPQCTSPLSLSDVHALTWRCGDDQTWQRFAEASDEAALESLVREGGARRCPGARCNYAFIRLDTDPRHFECPSCAEQFCLACPSVGGGVGPAHPGFSCVEYAEKLEADAEAKRKLDEWRTENAESDERFRALLRKEMRSGQTKPCPRCSMAIEHLSGCNHHTCSGCKTRFCWNCGGFNLQNPRSATCPSTCRKPARTWWKESELLGAITSDGGHSSSTASDGGHSGGAIGGAGPSSAVGPSAPSARAADACVIS